MRVKITYNLFIDDIRVPSTVLTYLDNHIYNDWDWEIVRSYDEMVEIITDRGLPSFVSFDHDLADITYDSETQTESFSYHETHGLDCVKWIVEYCIDNKCDFPEYAVHSQNPVGADNIHGYVNSFLKAKERGII